MKHLYYGKSVERKVSDESNRYFESEERLVNYELDRGETSSAKHLLRELNANIEVVKAKKDRWFLCFEETFLFNTLIGVYESDYNPQVGENVAFVGASGLVIKNEYNAEFSESMSHFTDIIISVKDKEAIDDEMEKARENFITRANKLIDNLQKRVDYIEGLKTENLLKVVKERKPKKGWSWF